MNSVSYDLKVDVFSFGVLIAEIVLKDLRGTGFAPVPDTLATCVYRLLLLALSVS